MIRLVARRGSDALRRGRLAGRRPAGRASSRLGSALPALLACVALAAAGCAAATSPGPGLTAGPAVTSSSGADSSGSPGAALVVLAPPTFAEALAAAAKAYEAATPGTTVAVTTVAPADLAPKVTAGAVADVLVATDTATSDGLTGAGLTVGPSVPIAGTTLVVVVPTANPAKITSPAELGKAGLRLLATVAEDPLAADVGDALAALAGTTGYAAGYAAAVERNVVSREPDARAALARIARGEGDAAIVYAADARAAGTTVKVIALPDRANLPGTASAVVLRASTHPDAAATLVAWLAGPDGQAILVAHGFVPPPQ